MRQCVYVPSVYTLWTVVFSKNLVGPQYNDPTYYPETTFVLALNKILVTPQGCAQVYNSGGCKT